MWVLFSILFAIFFVLALVLAVISAAALAAWRAEVKRNDRLALEKFDLGRPEPEIPFNPPDPMGQAVDKIFAEKEEMEKMGKELERLLNPPPED